jgi:hypothetical protein
MLQYSIIIDGALSDTDPDHYNNHQSTLYLQLAMLTKFFIPEVFFENQGRFFPKVACSIYDVPSDVIQTDPNAISALVCCEFSACCCSSRLGLFL